MQNYSHGDAFSEILGAAEDVGVQGLIVNQCGLRCGVGEWRKVIPESRDRLQSRVLVWVVAGVLGLSAMYNGISYILYIHHSLQVLPNEAWHVLFTRAVWHFLTPSIVSLTFGFLVWRTKSA